MRQCLASSARPSLRESALGADTGNLVDRLGLSLPLRCWRFFSIANVSVSCFRSTSRFDGLLVKELYMYGLYVLSIVQVRAGEGAPALVGVSSSPERGSFSAIVVQSLATATRPS